MRHRCQATGRDARRDTISSGPTGFRQGSSPTIRRTISRKASQQSVIDGLQLGSGDAVIGVNPASDSPNRVRDILVMLDDLRARLEIPTQVCVLATRQRDTRVDRAGLLPGGSYVPVDRRH